MPGISPHRPVPANRDTACPAWLASRPLSGGGTTSAIVGAPAGQGYVLGLAYDWGDAFVADTAPTRQLITNALAIPVPEPGSTALTVIAGLTLLRRRSRRNC